MLIFCSRLLEWSQIPALVTKYHFAKPNFVLIDAGYNPGRVYNFCASRGYTAMRGDAQTEFIHHAGRRRLKRYYSPVERINFGKQQAVLIRWSNERIKDILGRLRSRGGPAFEIPNEVMPDYQAHMVSEIKKDLVDKRTGDIQQRWVKIGSRANHLFDTRPCRFAGRL